MADIAERVEAEFENIRQLLAELGADVSHDELSPLEKAGLGALLHNFYNGMENVLKQVVLDRQGALPAGATWHRDLVTAASERGIISAQTEKQLRRYLAFRHFFSHGYALDLEIDRLRSLLSDAAGVFARFREEIGQSLSAH